MKNKLLFIILAFCIMGCSSTEPTEEQEDTAPQLNVISETRANPIETMDHAPDQTGPAEYIAWGSIKINNLLPLDANIRQVEAMFGKADSTFIPDYTNICYNCHFCTDEIPPFKNVYFKGVEFEQLNDSLIFWDADFTANKSLFLQTDNMRFDYKTTLEEVGKVFPEAARSGRREASGAWIIISPSKEPADGSFILEFNKDGYLAKFHYWFPC